jgi:transforming growth factor-beta-induced protein
MKADSPVLPEICEILDFRMDDQFPRIAGASRVGRVYKGAHRSLGDNTQLQRALQYDGERCSLNALDTMRLDPDLSKFVDLLEAAGLEDIFLCAGPFTVFAPTNEAFRSITPSIMRELLRPENQETLQQLLLYHMVPGYIPSSDLQAGPIETLLFGYSVDIAVDPFMVNDANILEPDLDACNGVIHTIDDVLVPETEDICDDYTFDDGSTEGQDCEPNVLEIARENPNFSVIVTLIEHVGLKDIFSCAGPFTALLPNNAAFDNLDPAYVDYLLLPENKQELEDVLLYHFLPGSTPVDDFTQGPAETLLAGATVEVTTSPIQFNNASVVNADDPACNGLVNEIDQVLLPFDFRKFVSYPFFALWSHVPHSTISTYSPSKQPRM